LDPLGQATGDPGAAFGTVKYGPPSSITPQAVLALQRAAGNQAVQRLLASRTQQRAAAPPGTGFSPNDETAGRIERARGGGQPLEGSLQEQMSKTMGHDFTGVRVHTDVEADELNRQLSAKAFTTGQDIYFSKGEYSPGSDSGRKLIGHELTHVVQQDTGRKQIESRRQEASHSHGTGQEKQVIQRYKVDPGKATLLGERKYATDADIIEFSNFTSCIGIVGRRGSQLTGIHLVYDIDGLEPQLYVPEDQKEQKEAEGAAEAKSMSSQIIGLLRGCQEVIIFGMWDTWYQQQSPNHQLLVLKVQYETEAHRIDPSQGGKWIVGPCRAGTLLRNCARRGEPSESKWVEKE